jgi:hypothetical protein
MQSSSNEEFFLSGREARHQCLIYNGAPSEQLPALGATLKQKLNDGFRCLYLNSAPMVAGMRSYLSSLGLDVARDVENGHLVFSSEPPSVGGEFDIRKMLDGLESALDKALADGYKGLWATGDMTFEFGARKNFAKLLEYEYRLEELMARRMELCGICQYHTDTLPQDAPEHALLTHQVLYINETLSRMNPSYVALGVSGSKPANP